MAREYTEDEVREIFLKRIWSLIEYWEKESRAETPRDKLEGLAFSTLAALDGGSAGLPGFIVAPSPHPDDKPYHHQEGNNWFPENDASLVNCDIGGSLHDFFHKFKPE